ncbi:sugar phosphate isomerase/epimerase family protein [Roseimaritima ulvae]|uniref:D-tagatose 3-epimerase n=1 Tax=Roseimaritima ulvae TaxID=980254 RepID=A0A5B9QX46_9BACT|nr:sugar phosphate isomerase/epimerase family protein [Roseimaritima ulvae]QEG42370.1 D-tagatose 3-epimerase [Roseimaritima ulvae]
MKFAICNETFGEWPLEKATQYAAEAGYTGWEVAPFMLTDDLSSYSQQQRTDYRTVVEDAGLHMVGLHWLLAKTEGLHLTSDDVQVRQKTAAYLCELARLCRDLGGKVLVLGSPQQRNVPEGMSQEEALDNATEVLKAVVPTLCDTDTRIALEPLGPAEGNFLNTAAEARDLADRFGFEAVGVHLDVKAMSSEAIPIPQIISETANHLLHFHANDPNRRGPGMGEVAYEPIFQALRDIDYDGWVSVEVFDYEPGVESLVTDSIRYMQGVLAS